MTKWYRKRTDQEALYVAEALEAVDLFATIGDVIHADDLPGVLEALGLSPLARSTLFRLTDPPIVSLNIPFDKLEQAELKRMKARLAELNEQIITPPYHSGSTTALIEERRALRRNITLFEGT